MSLAQLYFYRLWHSPCRTEDPARAELFFVPILAGWRPASSVNKACDGIVKNSAAFDHNVSAMIMASLQHLDAQTAPKHVFLSSWEHICGQNCTGWWVNPEGLLRSAIRISITDNFP
eukprot:3271840-Prymnesium_polylepis.1